MDETSNPETADTDHPAQDPQNKKDEQVIEQSSHAGKKQAGRPRYIVGIGASAGGLEALQAFFDNMPHPGDLAFVVAQHLSPDYKSLMVELLSKYTRMDVMRVEDGMAVRADTVYLIPPKKNMTLMGGMLYLSDQPLRHGLNLPIDVFFQSLAEDQREQAIGIILSGTGSDGTMGIRQIKELGGMVMVQEAASARFDGMPRSAIATGLVDFVLPPAGMPQQLLRFINHPLIAGIQKHAEAEEREPPQQEKDDGFGRIMGILKQRTRVDFSNYKPNTMIRRIQRRMGVVQATALPEYGRYLAEHPGEVQSLFKDLLISVTKFFRDPDAFEVLKRQIVPRIVENAVKRGSDTIRVWITGCATGEEAYTITILLVDHLEREKKGIDLKVFATDIDRNALEQAGIGLYPESIAADVDIQYLSRYFHKTDRGYQIRQSIRSKVVFALQNVIQDPPFTKIDLISCRNLLIYLQPVLQKRVLSIFNYALLPDGFLLLGSSESIGEMENEFPPFNLKQRIYRHRGRGILPVREQIVVPERTRVSGIAYGQADEGNGRRAADRAEQMKHFYHSIIRQIAPTLLIINESRELVQSFGNTRPFLSLPEGQVNLDILQMLPRELSFALASALHRVRKEQSSISYDDIRIRDGETVRMMLLSVDRLPDMHDEQTLYMIRLEEQDTPEESTESPAGKATQDLSDHRISDLEQEMQFTKENLQAAIEELQTANEELQASNEELLASNEELQSTNEELQSVNEELNTVNHEYQEKVAELSDLNNDINNLLKSTAIGFVFLDKSFAIRKFRLENVDSIDLIEEDIGRALTTFSIPMLKHVPDHFESVIRTRTAWEDHIQADSGKWYLLRVLPYIDENDQVDGLILTFTEITEIKQFEYNLVRSEMVRRSIMENTPALIYIKSVDGRIIDANPALEAHLGKDREDIVGEKDAALFPEPLVRQKQQHHQRVLETRQPVQFLETLAGENGERRFVTLKYPVPAENGEVESVGTVSVEVTGMQQLTP